jgi:hypothetical protein
MLVLQQKGIVGTGNLVGQAFVGLGTYENPAQHEPRRNQSNACQEEPTGLFYGHEQTKEVRHAVSKGNLSSILSWRGSDDSKEVKC